MVPVLGFGGKVFDAKSLAQGPLGNLKRLKDGDMEGALMPAGAGEGSRLSKAKKNMQNPGWEQQQAVRDKRKALMQKSVLSMNNPTGPLG